MNDWTSWLGHGLSLTAIVGAFIGLLTPLAALAAGVYYSVQVYESKTVKGFVRRRRERRLARLKLRLGELEDMLKE